MPEVYTTQIMASPDLVSPAVPDIGVKPAPKKRGPKPRPKTEKVAAKAQRGRKRKTEETGLRRLSVDVSLETWSQLHVESARRKVNIKDLLSEAITFLYGGQTLAEVRKETSRILVEPHIPPAAIAVDSTAIASIRTKLFKTDPR